ncbi:MAG: dTMP kinase [Candidatus Dormibacterales bacterium]
MGHGLFVTFEGAEGSGKTTQVEMLVEWLAPRVPVVVREPGGTELGEKIRAIVLLSGLAIDPEAEAYLFMAARRQLVGEVIEPALAAGEIVIADRYHDSTLAYQGGGRGLSLSWLPSLPRPDVTFLLEGPVETGRGRQKGAGKTPDRLEMESFEFYEKVVAEYARLADAEPERFTRIDATRSKERVHLDVRKRLEALMELSR